MTGDGDKCQTCQNDQINCKCETNSSKPFIHSSIKPPDLFVVKEDLSQYERKLKRWSRACGIPLEQQGDIIIIIMTLLIFEKNSFTTAVSIPKSFHMTIEALCSEIRQPTLINH